MERIEDIVTVSTRHVSCDGGEIGHPKVYLEIKQGVDEISCPYCSKIFIYKEEK